MDRSCIVLMIGVVALCIGLHAITPKPVAGEPRSMRWVGVLVGALGLLS